MSLLHLTDSEAFAFACRAAFPETLGQDHPDFWVSHHIGRWDPRNDSGQALDAAITVGFTVYTPTDEYPFACIQDSTGEIIDVSVHIDMHAGDKKAAMRDAIWTALVKLGMILKHDFDRKASAEPSV